MRKERSLPEGSASDKFLTAGDKRRDGQRQVPRHIRLQLHALAHNLDNFVRMLVAPKLIEDWSRPQA